MDGGAGIREMRHDLPAEDRRRIVERIVEGAGRARGLIALYVHGSFSRGERFADIDLAVLPAKGITGGARKAATDLLDAAAAPYDADVRWLDEAPPHFRYRVIAEGRLAWESDPVARADFVERALIEHFDTAWMREELLRGALGIDG